MKVDIVGRIGEGGGVGNYSTKLYHHLSDIDDLEVGKIEPKLKLPLLESTFQNFLEVPIRVLMSDADVVHLTDQEKASGLAFFPKFLLDDVVVTVHDISPYVNDYAGPVSQIVSRFYCRAIRKIPKIIAISQFTKEELIENLDIPEERIDVVYQGVDQDYFYPRELDEEKLEKYGIERPYILYVGSEIDRKNMKGVLKKFKELQEENPDLTLVKAGTAGRQKYRDKTKNYMRDLQLQEGEDVIFSGFIDEEDLPQIYSSAEATILWSHYEGFGRSILESKACATQILTREKPPMSEYKEWERDDIYDWDKTAKEILAVYEG